MNLDLLRGPRVSKKEKGPDPRGSGVPGWMEQETGNSGDPGFRGGMEMKPRTLGTRGSEVDWLSNPELWGPGVPRWNGYET